MSDFANKNTNDFDVGTVKELGLHHEQVIYGNVAGNKKI